MKVILLQCYNKQGEHILDVQHPDTDVLPRVLIQIDEHMFFVRDGDRYVETKPFLVLPAPEAMERRMEDAAAATKALH